MILNKMRIGYYPNVTHTLMITGNINIDERERERREKRICNGTVKSYRVYYFYKSNNAKARESPEAVS
jgi:hypothetical protein